MLLFGGHGENGERLGDLHTLRQTSGEWAWSQEHQPAIGARPVGESTRFVVTQTGICRADLHTLRQAAGEWTWSQEHQPAISAHPVGVRQPSDGNTPRLAVPEMLLLADR